MSHRKRLVPFVLAVLFISLTGGLHGHPGKVIRSLPAPGGFVTGMTFDGEHLWVADYKADKLFKIDPGTGKVAGAIPSPGYWPRGLAWDGTHLWNVDGKTKKIMKLDPDTGRILTVLDAPSSAPEGLAWDGETLWVSDAKAKRIMKIDLSDGTAVKTVNAPAKSADGLTFDGTYLWCSDRLLDELYMIEPTRGEVILILDAPGPYPRGLAFDGRHLWCADHQEDRLIQVVRRDDHPYRLDDPRRARITVTHEVKVSGPGSLNRLDVFFAVPGNRPGQSVETLTFSPRECPMRADRWRQPVACFHHEAAPTGSVIRAVMEVEAEISAIRYFIFPETCGTMKDIPPGIVKRYTADGTKYCTGDPYIRDLAQRIKGDETNPYYVARKIFDHVRNGLEYKLEGGWNAAPVVLKRGTGSCSEYSFCFIALCRAAGLPARYVGAYVVRGDDASFDDVFHRWPEVYLPGYSWVPMDPQGGDKPLPRDRAMNIGNLSNRFLITTEGGGDSEYLGWYYNSYETYETDPKVEVNVETFAEWEPLTE